MTTAQADSERVQTRVSPQINDEIEARAKTKGLNKAEWIRVVILAAVEQDSERSDAIDRLGPYLEARFEQLEARIFHENSVTLHLLFETFREAVRAATAGMSGASSLPPDDDTEADERRHLLVKEAETEFQRRYAELMATLKGMRDEAKTKSRALAKPLNGSTAGSNRNH